MMFKNLYIAYSNPTDPLDTVTLQYRLRDNSVVPKWCERIESAQEKYPIDAPDRFYGFGTIQEQIQQAIKQINSCIKIVNKFEPIIDRQLKDVNDQDTLNYLHHIFEVYHGLLDQQTHEFWLRAPKQVQRALADLNVLVHRCESVQRKALPRHVVTYYGLPKTEILDQEDYSLFEDAVTFGTVYLNYVEIGKTLTDLALDNDQYISDEAFKPFTYYSADFTVRFFHPKLDMLALIRAHVSKYYSQNKQFFLARGLEENHPLLKPGLPPIADLDNAPNNVLELLASRQFVKSVNLT